MADPDVVDTLSLRFSSQACSVRDAVVQLRTLLEAHAAPANACTSAEIVAAELLNNVFEHAYLENPDGEISLDAVLKPSTLDLCVRDTGAPMPDHRLPTARLPVSDGPVDELPEGGFGWYLLHALTENLTYQRRHDVNITECTLRLFAPRSSPVTHPDTP